jgi:hypothetical protein
METETPDAKSMNVREPTRAPFWLKLLLFTTMANGAALCTVRRGPPFSGFTGGDSRRNFVFVRRKIFPAWPLAERPKHAQAGHIFFYFPWLIINYENFMFQREADREAFGILAASTKKGRRLWLIRKLKMH